MGKMTVKVVLKNNRIDAWKVMDSDFTYYAKIRNNSDIEIRKVGN